MTRMSGGQSAHRLLGPSRAARARHAAAAAAVVGAATAWEASLALANTRWYAGLLKPAFAPAPWLAAASSVALAVTLVWAFLRVLGRPDYLPDRPTAIRLFLIGLGLDAAWSWMFFAGRHPTVALAVAAALAVVAASAARHFAVVDRRAGLLLLPWVLATVFTFLLDLSIAMRNA